MRKLLCGVCCVAFLVSAGVHSTEARPNYLGAFKKQYPDVTGAAEAKCNVCHMGKSKKMKNDYGIAFGTTLNAQKVKDAEQLKTALLGTESKDSKVDGKTYGDLLKEGKLPSAGE